MHLGPVRVHADLHRLWRQRLNPVRLALMNHHRIGLQLYAERKPARVLSDLEKIAAHQNLASADGQEEHSGLRHLVEQIFDLRRSHLAMIVMIEITMDATLIAAVSQIKLYTQRNAEAQSLRAHLLHQVGHWVT